MANHPSVVGEGDLEWDEHSHGENFGYRRKQLGSLRIGGEKIGVSKGDYVALPARTQAAHQLVNDSGAVLRYLWYSTMVEPDVIIYPDSGKVCIFGGAAPGGRKEKRTFSKILREEAEVGNYEGEE